MLEASFAIHGDADECGIPVAADEVQLVTGIRPMLLAKVCPPKLLAAETVSEMVVKGVGRELVGGGAGTEGRPFSAHIFFSSWSSLKTAKRRATGLAAYSGYSCMIWPVTWSVSSGFSCSTLSMCARSGCSGCTGIP